MGDPTYIYKVILVVLANKEVVGMEYDQKQTFLYQADSFNQVYNKITSNKAYGEVLSIEYICHGHDFRKLTN